MTAAKVAKRVGIALVAAHTAAALRTLLDGEQR